MIIIQVVDLVTDLQLSIILIALRAPVVRLVLVMVAAVVVPVLVVVVDLVVVVVAVVVDVRGSC